VRQNPLYPSVRGSDKQDLPLADLRRSLEDPGKDPASVEKAARAVARIWADSLLPREQGVAYEFYANALLTWLPNKSRNTRRSYAGTLVQFFDFVSRSRGSSGDTLKLVAPHQLRQSDIDGFVAHLTRPAIHPETVVRDKAERVIFEWLQDFFGKNGGAKTDSNKVREGLRSEGLMDIVSEYRVPVGFRAAQSKGYDSFDLAISALARKRLVRRVPVDPTQLVAATPVKEGEMHPLYGLLPARVESANRAATQIQRVRALSSFWSHLLTDKKLGMSRRPGALEPINPWVEAGSTVKSGTGEDAIRKAQRKMSVEDLTNVIRKLGSERMASAGKFMTVSSILAVRDELAVFFFVSTGLRRSEGLMALVQNLKEPAGLLALDPGRELMILGGIRRKGKRQDEEVFVPRKILDLRAHMFGMMQQFVSEHDEAVASMRSQMGEEEAAMAVARRETFRKSFQAVLRNAHQGPLVPALGRWGNAVVKATDKAMSDNIALPQGDLSQVPMDGRNLLHRMQLLVAGKEERKLKYHPHSLRHLSVTMAEGIGEGSALGQAIAGHRSATTTDIYRDMVSLQAAAVLKVSRRLTDIFMKVEQGLQLAKAPAGAAEMPPVVEQPVVPEVPVEMAPSPEPVVLEPVEKIREAVKPIEIQTKMLLRKKLVDTVGRAMSPAARVDMAGDASEAKNLVTEADEENEIKPVVDNVNAVNTSATIFGVGTGGLSKEEEPKDEPEVKPKGKKRTSPKASATKATGMGSDNVQRAIEETLDQFKPEAWFLDAEAWQRNGEYLPLVYMPFEQVKATLAGGYVFGPQVVSRYGFTSDNVRKSLSIVTSMRTYLPFVFYFGKSTKSQVGDDGADGVPTVRYDNQIAGIEPGPRLLLKNPRKPREKKERGTPIKPDRLIYLPIMNLNNPSSISKFTDIIDYHYNEGKGGGLRNWAPDEAKAMVRWLCIMFSMSRRVQNKLGDSVSWVGTHDFLHREGEKTSETLARTRPRVFREPDPSMLASFLIREGKQMYGILGSNFRISDAEGRRDLVETRLANVLNSVDDYQKGDIGAFLSVYDPPEWIDSDDPIGELPQDELDELKAWLRTLSGKMHIIGFMEDASEMENFWQLIEPFAKSDAPTIVVPPVLKSKAKEFMRTKQVDLILGVRRCVRHLWDIRKSGLEDFLFRGKFVDYKKLNLFWGLFWSWVLPSTEQAKERLRAAGNSMGRRDVRNIIEVMMMDTASKVILVKFQEVFEKFTSFARAHIQEYATDEAARMIEAEAVKMGTEIASAISTADENSREKILNSITLSIEKYDRYLATSGTYGTTEKKVADLRKEAQDLAGRLVFKPGTVSRKDLSGIYAAQSANLAALVTSSAIIMAAAIPSGMMDVSRAGDFAGVLDMAKGTSEALAELADSTADAGSDKSLSLLEPGKQDQGVVDKADEMSNALLRLMSSMTPEQLEDVRVKELATEVAMLSRRYSDIDPSRDKARASFYKSQMFPVMRKIHWLSMEIRETRVKMLPGPKPTPQIPAKGGTDTSSPEAESEIVDEPDEPEGFDPMRSKVEPIRKGDPRWVDYSDNQDFLAEMIGAEIEKIGAVTRTQDMDKVRAVLAPSLGVMSELGSTKTAKRRWSDIALGVYYRLLDIKKSKGLTPNRDTRLDMMSADLLATPQVMLVQQIRLRIPLLLSVIFSLFLRLDLVLELEVVDEHLAEFVVLALFEEALHLLVQGLLDEDASGVALVEERLEQELPDPLALGLALVEDGSELVDPRFTLSVRLQGQVYMSLLVTHFRPPRPRMKCPRRLPIAVPCA
jgi:integrase